MNVRFNKHFIILFFLIAGFACEAQVSNPGTLPSIIPPSPEVASLTNVGMTSTGLHTGAARVNIPLYDLVVGSVNAPVSLSYSTNGTRTNDIPSRVGLGWNLIAGGCINRVIHDEEDDGALTVKLTPPNFNQPSQAVLNYLFYANRENYDTEADEYSFTFNGSSGKFFVDATGIIRVVDHSNFKISRLGAGYSITTGEGVIYQFGLNGAIEKTRDVKTNGNLRPSQIKTTAWFLSKIISPEGEVIDFNYASVYIKTKLGPYQSVILKTLQPGYPYTNFSGCAPFVQASGQQHSIIKSIMTLIT